jgi:hypothetical protein
MGVLEDMGLNILAGDVKKMIIIPLSVTIG